MHRHVTMFRNLYLCQCVHLCQNIACAYMPTYDSTWKLHAHELVHEYWCDSIWQVYVWTRTLTSAMVSGQKLHECEQVCTYLHMAVLRSYMPVNMHENCMHFNPYIYACMPQCSNINTLWGWRFNLCCNSVNQAWVCFSTTSARWQQGRRSSPSEHSVTFRQSVRIWSQSVLLLSSFFCDFVQRCSMKPSTIVSFLPVFKGSLQGHWIPYTGGESGSSNLPVSRSSLSSAHYGFSVPWRHLKYLYPL